MHWARGRGLSSQPPWPGDRSPGEAQDPPGFAPPLCVCIGVVSVSPARSGGQAGKRPCAPVLGHRGSPVRCPAGSCGGHEGPSRQGEGARLVGTGPVGGARLAMGGRGWDGLVSPPGCLKWPVNRVLCALGCGRPPGQGRPVCLCWGEEHTGSVAPGKWPSSSPAPACPPRASHPPDGQPWDPRNSTGTGRGAHH